MNLQKILGSKTFEEVKKFLTDRKFSVKESKLQSNLYLITYRNLFGVDWSEQWALQCRGTVLEKDSNRLVCYPFDKFFNAGEKHASDLDWASARIYEKLDGSLIKVYWHLNSDTNSKGEWIVATNGTIDARETQATDSMTFHQVFLDALKCTLQDNSKSLSSSEDDSQG